MTPARWQRVADVVDRLLDTPPGERGEVLDAECGGDDDLRTEVSSLLAAEGDADSVSRAIRTAVDDARRPAEAEVPRAGDRIGAYEIERELGRGGMGVVYLGRRADRAYEGRVALKLLPRTADGGDDLARRFQQERQILARLDHPNIARLLDAGKTAAGRPYLVMEHVEGTAIDTWCDDRRLGIDDRIRLFLRIADAVQAAHRALIVHRDLKPANVLVTPDGVPKLLDFGIAKPLGAHGLPYAAETTVAGPRPMTLTHASPEQVAGDPVTTGTDVYGLGVTLYQLLTGHLPYPDDVPLQRAIVEREPIPASVRASAGAAAVAGARGTDAVRLRRRLTGDLDTILATALAKEPARRYGSVESFAADLRRHLEGKPVTARRPTLAYRMVKLVRRNRLAAALVAVLTLSVLAFGTSMGVLADRLADERDRAEAERDRARHEEDEAERVAALLSDLFERPDPRRAQGEPVTAREILLWGAERVERELAAQPETQARLFDTIGRAYAGLGLYDDAAPLLERALDLRRRILGADHPLTLDSLHAVAANHTDRGDFLRARELYLEVAASRASVLGEESPEVADTLGGLADVYRMTGELDEAVAALDRALAIRRGRPHEEEALATTVLSLALVESARDRLPEAEELFREAEARFVRHHGADHPDVLKARKGIANMLRLQGRHPEAETAFRRLLENERRVLGERHPNLAYTLAGIGYACASQDRPAEAEAYFREALALQREVLGDDHPALLASVGAIAVALRNQGRLDEAERLFRQADADARRLFPPDFPERAHLLVGLGDTLNQMGRADDAEPFLREAVELRRRTLGPENPLTAQAESSLGECLVARGRLGEAEPLLRHALAVQSGHPGHPSFRDATRRRLAAVGAARAGSTGPP